MQRAGKFLKLAAYERNETNIETAHQEISKAIEQFIMVYKMQVKPSYA